MVFCIDIIYCNLFGRIGLVIWWYFGLTDLIACNLISGLVTVVAQVVERMTCFVPDSFPAVTLWISTAMAGFFIYIF